MFKFLAQPARTDQCFQEHDKGMAARLEGGRDTGKPQSFGLDPLRDPLRCERQAVTLTRAPQPFQKPFKTYLDSVHDCGAASDAENLAVLSQ